MKKLKLNLQQLDNVEVLTRSQLRNVLGGISPLPTVGRRCWGSCGGESPGGGTWISGCSGGLFTGCQCDTAGSSSNTCSDYPPSAISPIS